MQFFPKWSHGSWKRSNTDQHAMCMGGMEQIPSYFLSALPDYSISQWTPSVGKQEAFQRADFAIRNCLFFFFLKANAFMRTLWIWLCFLMGKKLQWVILNLLFFFKQCSVHILHILALTSPQMLKWNSSVMCGRLSRIKIHHHENEVFPPQTKANDIQQLA